MDTYLYLYLGATTETRKNLRSEWIKRSQCSIVAKDVTPYSECKLFAI